MEPQKNVWSRIKTTLSRTAYFIKASNELRAKNKVLTKYRPIIMLYSTQTNDKQTFTNMEDTQQSQPLSVAKERTPAYRSVFPGIHQCSELPSLVATRI